jgi:crotonobetainyl-CoA:carnitine CoA-transferase CaiB-like acyl-CoA transferase
MLGALDGLKVLDCTHVLAGAWCSLLLADLGADVVKIEPPGGEMTRGRPGAAFKPFDFANRNKRAIAVDITSPQGADVVRRLATTADIFVENYRPGALARSGLGYETLAALNPRLIYASVSGFGQTGPYRERGGLDLVAQAMSGIMSFTGEPNCARPVSAGLPMCDLNAGTFAALGILAAVNHRHLTGEGQYVETSLLEAAMAYTIWESGANLTTGAIAAPAGSRHRLAAPYEALKTADGFLVVGVTTQSLWTRLCEALGEPGLAGEAPFADGQARLANRDALQERLEAILARDTTQAWVERITARGVPCGPINDIAQALADPHLTARGFLTEVDGRRFPRTPLVMSQTPVAVERGPAAVGQHTREILSAAGMSQDEIDALVQSGAVAEPGAPS